MPLTPNPVWQMTLAGPIANGGGAPASYGELRGGHDRKFTFNLNKASTIEGTFDLAAPTTDKLLSLIVAGGGHVLLYRNKVLQMVTELTSAQPVGDDQDKHTIGIVATETMWPRLQGVILGASTTGLAGPGSATDQGTWLNSTLATANGASGWNSTIGTSGSITASNNITGGQWYFKPFMELMQELAATVAGFDFWQTPVDPINGTAGITGQLNIAPLKGTTKSNVAFEYGTGRRNARGYDMKVDYSLLANDIWTLPPDFPTNATLPITLSQNSGSAATRGWRGVVQPTDLQATALRQSYGDLAATIRGAPRQQFNIQPDPDVGSGRVPQFLVDYTTGDTVRGRVSDFGITLLDALVRVYGVEVALDDQGMQTDTLTLIAD